VGRQSVTAPLHDAREHPHSANRSRQPSCSSRRISVCHNIRRLSGHLQRRIWARGPRSIGPEWRHTEPCKEGVDLHWCIPRHSARVAATSRPITLRRRVQLLGNAALAERLLRKIEQAVGRAVAVRRHQLPRCGSATVRWRRGGVLRVDVLVNTACSMTWANIPLPMHAAFDRLVR